MPRIVVETGPNAFRVWVAEAPPSYALDRLSAYGTGHQAVRDLVPDLQRAVRDAEQLERGRDPERLSERTMRAVGGDVDEHSPLFRAHAAAVEAGATVSVGLPRDAAALIADLLSHDQDVLEQMAGRDLDEAMRSIRAARRAFAEALGGEV